MKSEGAWLIWLRHSETNTQKDSRPDKRHEIGESLGLQAQEINALKTDRPSGPDNTRPVADQYPSKAHNFR